MTTCQECAFWVQFNVDGDEIQECRRFAPRPIVRDDIAEQYMGWWPVTMPYEGCGEGERR